MKVIKRNGRVEEFDINKIKLTIQKASEETYQPFTGSDINNLSQAINSEVHKAGREQIKVSEILDILVSTLVELGFNDVAKFYKNYETNFYKGI